MLEDHMLVSRQKGEESEEDQGVDQGVIQGMIRGLVKWDLSPWQACLEEKD